MGELPNGPSRRTPVRTCVGCRQAAPAQGLVRLALRQGDGGPELVVVTSGRNRPAGRGAWLHPSEPCVSAATRTRAFDRAFRAPVGRVHPDSIWNAVSTAVKR